MTVGYTSEDAIIFCRGRSEEQFSMLNGDWHDAQYADFMHAIEPAIPLLVTTMIHSAIASGRDMDTDAIY